MENVIKLLQSLDISEPRFPPTLIYNEGWLLRILLSWLSSNRQLKHSLRFQSDAKWFSEAQLPTPFTARYRGDNLAESRTNADGAIGQFIIGSVGRTDIDLIPSATQFIVVEGKLLSKLSSRTKNAPGYDQAARTVACIAEVLKRTDMDSIHEISMGFFLLAPDSQVSINSFPEMNRESIQRKVKRRIDSYEGEKDAWYREWFLPMMNRIEISIITWEEVIDLMISIEPGYGSAYEEFYEICMKVNG